MNLKLQKFFLSLLILHSLSLYVSYLIEAFLKNSNQENEISLQNFEPRKSYTCHKGVNDTL